MKKITLGLLFAAVVSSCGAKTESKLSSESASSTDARHLVALRGYIKSVEMTTASGSDMTNVKLEFMVPCTTRLETIGLNHIQLGSKTVIYATAIGSTIAKIGQPTCLSITSLEKTYSIPGQLKMDQISLEEMKTPAAEMGPDITAASIANSVKVVGLKSMCPDGAMCLVNGTQIELEVTRNSCVNSIPVVAYKIVQDTASDKSVTIALSPVEFLNKRSIVVRCSNTVFTSLVSISLVNKYVNEDQIKLLLVK